MIDMIFRAFLYGGFNNSNVSWHARKSMRAATGRKSNRPYSNGRKKQSAMMTMIGMADFNLSISMVENPEILTVFIEENKKSLYFNIRKE